MAGIASPATVSDIAPLYQRLPASLQKLVVRHCHEKRTTEVIKQLMALLPQCKDALPLLRKIVITSPDFDYSDDIAILRDQFAARGIKLFCEICEPSRNCVHCQHDEVGPGRETNA
ncbi:hypothetical protein EJ08DRAFT_95743 [Tothia fuscella]|uniref:Uncharacterized protein n=1 Tax=Tothia fuscella TaxID=1048955 RepID=A0A9P4NX01_9PEZI|nr:hypothetical protein EJ08DRAFT_95743 [Tothia fuscella]